MPNATAPQTLDRDWFTVSQTAAYLQVSTRTVHRYLDSGLLSASQLVPGGTIRISAIGIEKMLEKRQHYFSHSSPGSPNCLEP
jgi:excisionase family DNA binding protein